MRSILLAACLAIGASTVALVAPAQARVDINLPGVHIDSGRHHRDWHDWHRHAYYGDRCWRWGCRG
jgi:hypothetical protein